MKNKKLLAVFALVLFTVTAVSISACSKKAEEETTQAQSTTEENTVEQTQAEASAGEKIADSKITDELSLNFEIVNHVGGDYDSIIMQLGEPADKKEDDVSNILYYKNPDRMLVLYPDTNQADEAGLCWIITTNMGDLWGVKDKSIKADDFLNLIGAADISYNKNVDENDFTIGKKDQETVEFVSEGYMFVIALDENREFDADSAVGIYSLDILPVN